MLTSDFRPEVEMRPFRACAMKNMQYKPYLWPNCQNVRVIQEIGVEEHDGDVRFFIGSGNTAVSRMRNEKYASNINLIYGRIAQTRVIQEIGVEEHDGDVRFQTGSGNTAVSRMRNEKYAI